MCRLFTNNARLNTYLDLKTENEQLQKRLLELRSRMPVQTTLLGPLPLASQSNPIYATSSLQSQRVLPAPVVPSQGVVDVPNSYYPTTSVSSASYDDSSSSTGSLFDNNTFNTGSIFAPSIAGPSNAEDDEDGSKKKKVCCISTIIDLIITLCITSAQEVACWRTVCVHYVWSYRFS
jgi:hypothetical protein